MLSSIILTKVVKAVEPIASKTEWTIFNESLGICEEVTDELQDAIVSD
jgi:hypothetical protein